jgi:hypothetical protein
MELEPVILKSPISTGGTNSATVGKCAEALTRKRHRMQDLHLWFRVNIELTLSASNSIAKITNQA